MKAMLAESTLHRLRSQLDCLPVILAGTQDGAMDRRPASRKWSARENLAHLARYQSVFIERVQRILAEARPIFPSYKAENDPEWPVWAAMTAEEVLESLRSGRAEIVSLFELFSDAQLARTATHSRFGELTLAQWLEFFLLHEAHHLLAVLQRLRSPD